MDVNNFLRLLRRHWVTVAALTLTGVLLAGIASFSMRPTYTAETQLFIAIQSAGSAADLQQANSFSEARVQSYVQTVTTPAVLQPVVDSLGLELSPGELAENVQASADLNTVIITISASDSSPVRAAAIAQSVADSLIVVVESLESPSASESSPVQLSIITPATAPSSPASPNVPLYLVFGGIVGLLLGIGVAVLRSTLDTRIRGEAEVRRVTDSPILGGVAYDSDATKKPLLTQTSPQSPRAESFRQIRTNLQFSHVSLNAKAILLTSSLPGEGKSTTAVNLAIAISQAGQSVVLIDADLRRPRVNEYLGLERNAGLTTALIGRAAVEDLLQPWGEDELYVLTSGQIPPNPSELLGSKRMKDLISALEQKFDAVVIDAPPLLPVTDAAVLAQHVGGVVIVVGSSKVKGPDLVKSLGALEMVDADVLGVVINLLPTKGPDAYAYTYYTSEDVPEQIRVRKRSSKMEKSRVEEPRSADSDFDDVILRRAQSVSRETHP